MLTIQNIRFSPLSIKKYGQKTEKSIEQKHITGNFKTVYPPNINFCASDKFRYTPKSFEQTVKENYFQLPKVQFKDGSSYQLPPDAVQLECAKKLYNGDSVVFCAPTGTGKTAVAHYAITQNLKKGKKTIYTTPLKALANDKLREFRKIYGEDNVGLLTGDIKLNTNAPVQIMTTEIYNNQANGLFENTRNIGTVIFDEAHYLGDEDRGNVWENSILKTPLDKIQILCLSATIGNSDSLTDWIQSLNPSKKVSKVELPSTERYTPLVTLLYQTEKNKDKTKGGENKFIPITDGRIILDSVDANNLSSKQKRAVEIIFKTQNGIEEYYEMTPEQYSSTAQKLISLIGGGPEGFSVSDFKEKIALLYPEISPVQCEEIAQLLLEDSTKEVKRIHIKTQDENYPVFIKDLKDNNMLPALIFELSKSDCEYVAYELKEDGVDLTDDDEKKQIEQIIEQYRKNKVYLGTHFDKKMLLSGFAYHHAGELPQYRKLIEELFSKKLLKAVIATSTLSAGINMPARTVTINNAAYQKFNPETKQLEYIDISASEFHQMAGRAGRRGIDSLGYVVLYNLNTPSYGFKENKPKSAQDFEETKKSKRKLKEEQRHDELQIAYNLLESPADNLRSQFRPDWQMLSQYYTNNHTPENLKKLIASSFKTYLSKNPEKEERALMNKFENYKIVLLKQGFLEKNSRGEISVTPKGRILNLSQGINPLMLSSLIYDEKLKGLEPEQLCQILGYIAGSSEQQEDSMLSDLIDINFTSLLQDEADFKEQKSAFKNTRSLFLETESKVLKSVRESKIKPEEIVMSESFSGYAAYIWAHLNDKSRDTISNFRKITGSGFGSLSRDEAREMKGALKEHARKSIEGNVYKILAQVVSILKQIERICDFALSNPNIYPNNSYYEELKETAQLAMLLAKQNPVYDESNL